MRVILIEGVVDPFYGSILDRDITVVQPLQQCDGLFLRE